MLSMGGRGGWLAGLSHVYFIAMLWSKLQVCEISSKAEIFNGDYLKYEDKLKQAWAELCQALLILSYQHMSWIKQN